jgi:acyl-CoA hydrolase
VHAPGTLPKTTVYFSQLDEACEFILQRLQTCINLATPLGLGKPNQLLNLLYSVAKQNPALKLDIFTALSLQTPSSGHGLQARFLGPFKDRFFGKDYPDLEYAKDSVAGRLPANVRVREFYFQAGKSVQAEGLQQDYVSANYTHVPQVIFDQKVNVIVQLISKSGTKISLSCNPDITLDVIDLYEKAGLPLLLIGVVHPDLPFMHGDAEVDPSLFDAIVESSEVQHRLFALPRQAISEADYVIGLQASLLVEDGGSLQIGIGSLSDALVYCLQLRQLENSAYRNIARELLTMRGREFSDRAQVGTFEHGLYGTSEMVMDGFMHLRKAGILKREVRDLDAHVKRYLHGGFFLGTRVFYDWLRQLHLEGDTGIGMSRISKVNDLYDEHEFALRRQRVKARFFNTTMSASLLGSAASETLENGQVVSGVGGQYNFVAMAHELSDANSVLMLRSLRESPRGTVSNIVWGHQHATIPRHLRDIFITEYGVAFTKGKTDSEVIQSMVELADARFQDTLIKTAQENGKFRSVTDVKASSLSHSAAVNSAFLHKWKQAGFFPEYPFGSDFTETEIKIVAALTRLKQAKLFKPRLLPLLARGLGSQRKQYFDELNRMDLLQPKSLSERLLQTLLLGALSSERTTLK